MHLCCAYVLPWSVCVRSTQHRAPAASHTGAGHKGGNPYTAVPPVEDPNYATRINLGLVPTLQLGQDELGFAVTHQTMFAVCLTKKPCAQWQPEKQHVDGPHLFSPP